MKTIRSIRFLNFLVDETEECQRCKTFDMYKRAAEKGHPPKRRPWGGGMGQKASDLGSLHLCDMCHRLEHSNPIGAWNHCDRDDLALQNLIRYAEHLDPSIDLRSELLERAQVRVIQLEGGES